MADEMAKHDDYELKTCPGCGQKSWRRQLSAPMVMKEAIPDGTNRFADLKATQRLKRASKEAQKKGDFVTEKKAKQEIKERNKR